MGAYSPESAMDTPMRIGSFAYATALPKQTRKRMHRITADENLIDGTSVEGTLNTPGPCDAVAPHTDLLSSTVLVFSNGCSPRGAEPTLAIRGCLLPSRHEAGNRGYGSWISLAQEIAFGKYESFRRSGITHARCMISRNEEYGRVIAPS